MSGTRQLKGALLVLLLHLLSKVTLVAPTQRRLDYRNGNVILDHFMAYVYVADAHPAIQRIVVVQKINLEVFFAQGGHQLHIARKLERACRAFASKHSLHYTSGGMRAKQITSDEEVPTFKIGSKNTTYYVRGNGSVLMYPTSDKYQVLDRAHVTKPVALRSCQRAGMSLVEPRSWKDRQTLVSYMRSVEVPKTHIGTYYDVTTATQRMQSDGESAYEVYPEMAGRYDDPGLTLMITDKNKLQILHNHREYMHTNIHQKYAQKMNLVDRDAIARGPTVCQRSPNEVRGQIAMLLSQSLRPYPMGILETTLGVCRNVVEFIQGRVKQIEQDNVDLLTAYGLTRVHSRDQTGHRHSRDTNLVHEAAGKSQKSKRAAISLMLGAKLVYSGVIYLLSTYHESKQDQKISENEARLLNHAVQLDRMELIQVNQQNRIDELEQRLNMVAQLAEKTYAATYFLATINQARVDADQHQFYFSDGKRKLERLLDNYVQKHLPDISAKALQKLDAEHLIVGGRIQLDPTAPPIISRHILNDVLDVAIQFLVSGTEAEIYQVIALPKFRKNVMYTRKLDFNYILVYPKPAQYIGLTEMQAATCQMGPCQIHGLRRQISDELCTISPFLGKTPSRDCPVHRAVARPFFMAVKGGLLYSVQTPVKIYLECNSKDKHGPDFVSNLVGTGVAEISEGCVLNADEPKVRVYGGALQLNVELIGTVIKHTSTSSDEEWDFSKYVQNDTMEFEAELLVMTEQLLKANLHRQLLTITGVVAAIILLLTIFVVACFGYTGRSKILRMKVRLNTIAKKTIGKPKLDDRETEFEIVEPTTRKRYKYLDPRLFQSKIRSVRNRHGKQLGKQHPSHPAGIDYVELERMCGMPRPQPLVTSNIAGNNHQPNETSMIPNVDMDSPQRQHNLPNTQTSVFDLLDVTSLENLPVARTSAQLAANIHTSFSALVPPILSLRPDEEIEVSNTSRVRPTSSVPATLPKPSKEAIASLRAETERIRRETIAVVDDTQRDNYVFDDTELEEAMRNLVMTNLTTNVPSPPLSNTPSPPPFVDTATEFDPNTVDTPGRPRVAFAVQQRKSGGGKAEDDGSTQAQTSRQGHIHPSVQEHPILQKIQRERSMRRHVSNTKAVTKDDIDIVGNRSQAGANLPQHSATMLSPARAAALAKKELKRLESIETEANMAKRAQIWAKEARLLRKEGQTDPAVQQPQGRQFDRIPDQSNTLVVKTGLVLATPGQAMLSHNTSKSPETDSAGYDAGLFGFPISASNKAFKITTGENKKGTKAKGTKLWDFHPEMGSGEDNTSNDSP